MKALVTGASGFIGSHIAERLVARGDEVRALVRSSSDTRFLQGLGIELVQGDITDTQSLVQAIAGVDVVYHAAAMVTDWAPWSEFQRVTVDGTRNVLAAAAGGGVPRVLYVSTDGVYALSAFKGVVTEESPLEKRFGWLDYYRRSKLAGERIAARYGDEGKIKVTIVRPGLVFGERDRAMFPGIVTFLKSSSSAYLGSGDNPLPYVYVGDVADACILGATADAAIGRTYNVVSDEPVTQKQVYDTIADAAGLRRPRRHIPVRLIYGMAAGMEAWCLFVRRRKVHPEITRFGVILLAFDFREDASRLRSELGWVPQVQMQEAVRRCVDALEREPAGR
ncbi:MAG TPA: NAD-dependent epimerase/dehydratase family protein [Dehalococcoidia bacterium]|nr:NAD-dependent epimerase/dehydratase family protein [Dehalococcoidia bacterium]